MANARFLAVKALCELHELSGYSNIVLSKTLAAVQNITPADKALASALFYGVLDRLITIDFLLSRFLLKTSVAKLSPITKEALRIALYQILYMDKIPESAAVNESVKLVKASKERHNAGFVNAVLRSALRGDLSLPEGESPEALSVRYSAPMWIVKSFSEDYGSAAAAAILEDSLQAPPTVLRCNTLKITPEALISELQKEGVKAETSSVVAALVINGGIDIRKSRAYKKGLFHVQDFASQLTVSALEPKPGERLLDICAAPGGKSFTAAELMENKGEVVSLDLYEHRVRLISKGAERLGLNIISAGVADATVNNEKSGLFDAVLCDVPCSGLGVIRRKPEIKYKENEDFSALQEIQSKILSNAAGYLKPGGRLLYSTCTMRKAENEAIVNAFLDKTPGYELQYQRIYMPHIDNTDGFYCALIKKSR